MRNRQGKHSWSMVLAHWPNRSQHCMSLVGCDSTRIVRELFGLDVCWALSSFHPCTWLGQKWPFARLACRLSEHPTLMQNIQRKGERGRVRYWAVKTGRCTRPLVACSNPEVWQGSGSSLSVAFKEYLGSERCAERPRLYCLGDASVDSLATTPKD